MERLTALGQMLVVTILWSSSFPIYKALINDGMPPISLAAYRYFSASIILVILLSLRTRRESRTARAVKHPGFGQWLALLGIGFFMYTAQGVHITALSLITASDSGLVSMTFLPVAVAILTSIIERTPPTRVQMAGLGIILAGIFTYFPHTIHDARLAGVLLNVLSSSMWAVATVITHMAVTKMRITSLKLTAVSMMSGSSLLLVVALMRNGFYVPGLGQMLWLAFLVFVNTAFAFVLFNHTMKVLGAFEIAAFQDSMVIQIGILSALFLREPITLMMALGMLLVTFGVVVVQYFAPHR
jgi:drug/metabolite transporter (DMT)-like permease